VKKLLALVFLLLMLLQFNSIGVATDELSGTFTPLNTMGLYISGVTVNPEYASINSYVNVSCTIVSNGNITVSKINFTSAEYDMDNVSSAYYYNTTYSTAGVYSFHIYAEDDTGNSTQSSTYEFTILGAGGGGGGSIISLFLPTDTIYENDSCIVLILVNNPTVGLPETGKADDILLYVYYPNMTLMIAGSHPFEFTSGVYLHNLTVSAPGDYICKATVSFGSVTYMDAGFFNVKYDYFRSIIDRIDEQIITGILGRHNLTRIFSYRITNQDIAILEMSEKMDNMTHTESLRDIALREVFGTGISIIVITVLLAAAGLIWGKRRGKRLVRTFSTSHVAEKLYSTAEKEPQSQFQSQKTEL